MKGINLLTLSLTDTFPSIHKVALQLVFFPSGTFLA